jgi:transcriptional regulator with XRE-family HTH domain
MAGRKASPKRRKTIVDPRYRDLVQELRRAREDHDMSQGALGEAVGRDQMYISRIESGDQRIDIFEFVQLCQALNLDWARLLKRFAT